MALVTLHHSLYYAPRATWSALVDALHREILGPSSAIHAVLMASASDERTTTTWLYDHFAGRFCGARNDQDLRAFGRDLARTRALPGARVQVRSSRVRFVDDFERFMRVVWMILLYPNVHRYTAEQRAEIIEHVYEELWRPGIPLAQIQDHLVIFRGATGEPRGERSPRSNRHRHAAKAAIGDRSTRSPKKPGWNDALASDATSNGTQRASRKPAFASASTYVSGRQ